MPISERDKTPYDLYIWNLLKEKRRHAVAGLMREVKEYEGQKASIRVWNTENPDIIGAPFGRPRDPTMDGQTRARDELHYMDEVIEYFTTHFMELAREKDGTQNPDGA